MKKIIISQVQQVQTGWQVLNRWDNNSSFAQNLSNVNCCNKFCMCSKNSPENTSVTVWANKTKGICMQGRRLGRVFRCFLKLVWTSVLCSKIKAIYCSCLTFSHGSLHQNDTDHWQTCFWNRWGVSLSLCRNMCLFLVIATVHSL